jgi:predicted transcriptional regulator of viral defense system
MENGFKDAERRLYETAETQQGFFTTKQAIHAGFGEKTHSYHVRVGNWIREHRGIYRLAEFPTTDRPDLMLWYLWSQNRQEVPEGTYSHDTALSLQELSDIMPSKLHMTVPKHFRRNSRIPEILVLHKADLSEGDRQDIYGVRVTRPLRTIMDLLESGHVDRTLIRQAIDQAMRRGLISTKQIEALPHNEVQRSLRDLVAQHN